MPFTIYPSGAGHYAFRYVPGSNGPPAFQSLNGYQTVAQALGAIKALQAANLAAEPIIAPSAVIGPGNLSLATYYDLGSNTSLGYQAGALNGLAMRRLNGVPTFYTLCYDVGPAAQTLIELQIQKGALVPTGRRWNDIFAGGDLPNRNDCQYGLSFDAKGRLWTTAGTYYPDAPNFNNPRSLQVRTLNDDGTISGLQGSWGLPGVSQRCIAGTVLDVPVAFQEAYGVDELAVTGGGYFSLVDQGGSCSYGPFVAFLKDPSGTPGGNIAAFKIALDYRTYLNGAWYPGASASTGYDRCVRNSDVMETYDNWTSPAPDGNGRFTWGDSVHQTGIWIETPTRHGILFLASLCSGNAGYADSQLNCDRNTFDFLAYDPADLGRVVQGQLQPWQLQPRRWPITLPGFGLMGKGTCAPSVQGRVTGLVFDPVDSCVYALGALVNGTGGGSATSRLFVLNLT